MKEELEGYVYILKSLKNGSYYIGSARNVEERLKRHNEGKVKATRNIFPLEICFSQKFRTVIEAKQVEFKLKKLKSRLIISRIIQERLIRIQGD